MVVGDCCTTVPTPAEATDGFADGSCEKSNWCAQFRVLFHDFCIVSQNCVCALGALEVATIYDTIVFLCYYTIHYDIR